jgi:hypothetical protein
MSFPQRLILPETMIRGLSELLEDMHACALNPDTQTTQDRIDAIKAIEKVIEFVKRNRP